MAFALYLACTLVAYLSESILLTSVTILPVSLLSSTLPFPSSFTVSDTATVIVSIVACRSFTRLALHAQDHQYVSSSRLLPLHTDLVYQQSRTDERDRSDIHRLPLRPTAIKHIYDLGLGCRFRCQAVGSTQVKQPVDLKSCASLLDTGTYDSSTHSAPSLEGPKS